MQTSAERARKDAFKRWLRRRTLPSNYDIGKWEEAFAAGWEARAKFEGVSRRRPVDLCLPIRDDRG